VHLPHVSGRYHLTYSNLYFYLLLILFCLIFISFYIFLFFLAVLKFEHKSLQLLGRCSTAWATPLSLFCFNYILDRVLCFWPRVGFSPLFTYLLLQHKWGYRMHTTLTGLFELGVLLTFSQAGLQLWSFHYTPPCIHIFWLWPPKKIVYSSQCLLRTISN
jgi:hypothetical protein